LDFRPSEAFFSIDTLKKGYISTSDLNEFMTKHEHALSYNNLKTLFSLLDFN